MTVQIAEARVDIQLLKEEKEQAVKDKEAAEKRAEKAEKDLHSLEERRERLQPVMDNVSKEIKEYGTIKEYLPEAGTIPVFIDDCGRNCVERERVYVSRKGSGKAALW